MNIDTHMSVSVNFHTPMQNLVTIGSVVPEILGNIQTKREREAQREIYLYIYIYIYIYR